LGHSGGFETTSTQSQHTLLALSALMTRSSQQLTMFVLSHFFSALFNNAAQWITSSRLNFDRLHSTPAHSLSINFSLQRLTKSNWYPAKNRKK
jgi:hypothetical protein